MWLCLCAVVVFYICICVSFVVCCCLLSYIRWWFLWHVDDFADAFLFLLLLFPVCCCDFRVVLVLYLLLLSYCIISFPCVLLLLFFFNLYLSSVSSCVLFAVTFIFLSLFFLFAVSCGCVLSFLTLWFAPQGHRRFDIIWILNPVYVHLQCKKFIKVTLLTFSSGPDIPFVAVYKTQRDGESETQDRESEYSSWLQHRFAFTSLRLMLKTLAGDLVTQRRRENMENDLVRRGRRDHLCTESLFVHQPSPGIMAVITLLLTMDVLITLWPARRLYQHTVMWSLQCVCVRVCVIFYQYDVPALTLLSLYNLITADHFMHSAV